MFEPCDNMKILGINIDPSKANCVDFVHNVWARLELALVFCLYNIFEFCIIAHY